MMEKEIVGVLVDYLKNKGCKVSTSLAVTYPYIDVVACEDDVTWIVEVKGDEHSNWSLSLQALVGQIIQKVGVLPIGFEIRRDVFVTTKQRYAIALTPEHFLAFRLWGKAGIKRIIELFQVYLFLVDEGGNVECKTSDEFITAIESLTMGCVS